MIWWVLALAAVAILSYLADVGVLEFLQEVKVPGLQVSTLSILILLCMLGILFRMLRKTKRGLRESLAKRIQILEEEVAALKKVKTD
jgi:hypothetical protein